MNYNLSLFPPQFTTTIAPVFLRSAGCRIHFALSNNVIQDIQQVHITVTDQKTNLSVLNKDPNTGYIKYNMIKPTSVINVEEEWEGEDRYYVTLQNSDIQNGFIPNRFYKVQIRFSNIEIQSGSDIYLLQNQSHFSEWSTVLLIRCMSAEPQIIFTEYPNNTNTAIFQSLDLALHGYVQFQDGDQQSLQSYRIKLYDDTGSLIQDSGNVITNKYYNSDNINYRFKSQLSENIKYYFTIQIVTNFYYSFPQPKKFEFEVIEPNYSSEITGELEYFPDSEIGCLGIRVKSESSSSNLVNLQIKRTSSESNYKIWEQVCATKYESTSALDYTWFDYTIKSGIFYKYAIHILDSAKHRKGLITHPDPVIVIFDHIYLISEDKQLTIKFNPQISSFTYNVAEGKTDTIGSQYPYARRNGAIYYRQFPLSGTISHFMDIKGNLLQASRNDIYRDAAGDYETYNFNNDITPYNDYIYERQFRDKVIEFLYKDNLKLFKSTTEGNIIVKISDISFTPNQTLGRMIYDFSCTCYEMAEATYDKIKQLGNILTILNNMSFELASSQEKYGQIIRPDPSFAYINNRSYFNYRENILNTIIQDKYNTLATETRNSFQKVLIDEVTYLRIQMLQKPYLIDTSNNQLRIIDTNMNLDQMSKLYMNIKEDYTNNPVNPNSTVLGYLILINGNKIFINAEGKYEISDSNLNSQSSKAFKITSIAFPKLKAQASIDYKVNIKIAEDVSKLPSSIATKETIGQLFGTFNINESIYRQIYKKYYFKKVEFNRVVELHELNNIWGLRITGRPGLAFEIKDTSKDSFSQITFLNETGMLEFYDTETSIILFRFLGYHVDDITVKLTEEQKKQKIKAILTKKETIRKGEFLKTDYIVLDLNDNDYRIPGLVINYQNKKYIYYDENWFPFDENYNIVKVSKIEAIIDYYAEIITKEYKNTL